MTSTIDLLELYTDMKHAAVAAFLQWPNQKVVAGLLTSSVFAIFPQATHEVFSVLMGVYLLDFVFGITAALLNGEAIERRKLVQSVGKAAFYLFFTVLVYKAVRIVPILGTQEAALSTMAVIAGIFIAQDLHSVLVNVQRAGIAKTTKAKKALKKVLEGSD